jgi:hypothetical protein
MFRGGGLSVHRDMSIKYKCMKWSTLYWLSHVNSFTAENHLTGHQWRLVTCNEQWTSPTHQRRLVTCNEQWTSPTHQCRWVTYNQQWTSPTHQCRLVTCKEQWTSSTHQCRLVTCNIEPHRPISAGESCNEPHRPISAGESHAMNLTDSSVQVSHTQWTSPTHQCRWVTRNEPHWPISAGESHAMNLTDPSVNLTDPSVQVSQMQ